MAKGIAALMPPIDKYIYVRCSVPLLQQRLRQRGREYESELGRAYAEKQKELYDAWAAALPADKLMIVDADEGVDLDAVARFIES